MYLLKTEPSEYSFADLAKAGETVWDGVTNPLAVKHLRGMKKGERVIVYHTGAEKRTAGTATVVSVDASDAKLPKVKLKAGAAVKRVRTLEEIKASALFQESPLVKMGRLSVVPLTAAQWKWLAE